MLGCILQLSGNICDGILQSNRIGIIVKNCFLVDDIDDSFELIFFADGNGDREGVSAELLAHFAERIFEIRAYPIHLIDERDARNLVLGRLTPDRLRLRLHAGNATKNSNRPVEHPHGAFYFSSEIDVPRRIDNVNAMGHAIVGLVSAIFLLGPVTGGRGRGDSDAAFAFLLHPIGYGVAVIDIAHLVDEAGVKEDALGGGRLASIDMRGDADVARALHRVLPLR